MVKSLHTPIITMTLRRTVMINMTTTHTEMMFMEEMSMAALTYMTAGPLHMADRVTMEPAGEAATGPVSTTAMITMRTNNMASLLEDNPAMEIQGKTGWTVMDVLELMDMPSPRSLMFLSLSKRRKRRSVSTPTSTFLFALLVILILTFKLILVTF